MSEWSDRLTWNNTDEGIRYSFHSISVNFGLFILLGGLYRFHPFWTSIWNTNFWVREKKYKYFILINLNDNRICTKLSKWIYILFWIFRLGSDIFFNINNSHSISSHLLGWEGSIDFIIVNILEVFIERFIKHKQFKYSEFKETPFYKIMTINIRLSLIYSVMFDTWPDDEPPPPPYPCRVSA